MSSHHEQRAGAIVDIANEPVGPPFRGMPAAVTQTTGIAPNDAAGFLQASVPPHDLAAHSTDVGVYGQASYTACQCVFEDQSIVVQQEEMLASSVGGGKIDRLQEAQIPSRADDRGARDTLQQLWHPIRRAIVNQDKLIGHVPRGQKCLQTQQAESGLVEEDHQHGDLWSTGTACHRERLAGFKKRVEPSLSLSAYSLLLRGWEFRSHRRLQSTQQTRTPAAGREPALEALPGTRRHGNSALPTTPRARCQPARDPRAQAPQRGSHTPGQRGRHRCVRLRESVLRHRQLLFARLQSCQFG